MYEYFLLGRNHIFYLGTQLKQIQLSLYKRLQELPDYFMINKKIYKIKHTTMGPVQLVQ